MIMHVFAALYDDGGDCLIAQKRAPSNWLTKETAPSSSSEEEAEGEAEEVAEEVAEEIAGRFCLPGGTQRSGETIMGAAARMFRERTGSPIPDIHQCSHTFLRSKYVLVCYKVINLQACQDGINKVLSPWRSNSAAPLSDAAKRGELARVLVVPRLALDRYLGAAHQPTDASAASLKGEKEKFQSIRWETEMADLLKTIR